MSDTAMTSNGRWLWAMLRWVALGLFVNVGHLVGSRVLDGAARDVVVTVGLALAVVVFVRVTCLAFAHVNRQASLDG